MTIGQNAPVDSLDRYAQTIASVDSRVGELERRAQRNAQLDARYDARYVNVTGDTMTRPLWINYTAADALRIQGNGGYEAFFDATGATRYGYLQGNSSGVVLQSETGRLNLNGVDGIQMSVFKINGYTASESATGNRIVLATAAGYINAVYLNMTANVQAGWPPYVAGQFNNDNYLRWWDKQGALSIGANMYTSNRTTGLSWGDAGIFCNPGVTHAGICMHPGGVAGNIWLSQNFASYMFVGTTGTEYYGTSASAFTVNSTRKSKQDIEPSPPKAPQSVGAEGRQIRAVEIVRKLEIVSYRRNEQDLMAQTFKSERRNDAWRRLNRYREHRGLAPYRLPIHRCEDDPSCYGTAQEPCAWRKNWAQPQLGLIVEDVIDMAPEIVGFDQQGEPGFIDVHSHVSLLHAAIIELEARINDLEGVT